MFTWFYSFSDDFGEQLFETSVSDQTTEHTLNTANESLNEFVLFDAPISNDVTEELEFADDISSPSVEVRTESVTILPAHDDLLAHSDHS